jgi:hypothetical protein
MTYTRCYRTLGSAGASPAGERAARPRTCVGDKITKQSFRRRTDPAGPDANSLREWSSRGSSVQLELAYGSVRRKRRPQALLEPAASVWAFATAPTVSPLPLAQWFEFRCF